MRLVGVLAAGLIVAVAAAQSPTSPRLTGEAAPPASSLSLWYRAPASDHPLLPLDAPRQARQAWTAEWVRALYGRYRLIASSRTGSQPANLQGIWNESMAPSWDSKYTININTEMKEPYTVAPWRLSGRPEACYPTPSVSKTCRPAERYG